MLLYLANVTRSPRGWTPTNVPEMNMKDKKKKEQEKRSDVRARIFLQPIEDNQCPDCKRTHHLDRLNGTKGIYPLVPHSKHVRVDNLDPFQRHQESSLVPRSNHLRMDDLDLLGGPNGKCFFLRRVSEFAVCFTANSAGKEDFSGRSVRVLEIHFISRHWESNLMQLK